MSGSEDEAIEEGRARRATVAGLDDRGGGGIAGGSGGEVGIEVAGGEGRSLRLGRFESSPEEPLLPHATAPLKVGPSMVSRRLAVACFQAVAILVMWVSTSSSFSRSPSEASTRSRMQ